MKKLGEDLGKKLGPGSDFEKQMKDLGQKMKEKAEAAAPRNKAESRADRGAPEKPKTAASAKTRRREARIAALEAQIRKLAEELKALEDDERDDDR